MVAELGFKLRTFSRKNYVDLLSTPDLRWKEEGGEHNSDLQKALGRESSSALSNTHQE